LRGANVLDSLYDAIQNFPLEQKKEAKKKAMTRIVETMDTLTQFNNKTPSKRFEKKLPNNSYFLSFRRYQSKQVDLTEMFRQQFSSNFKKMVDFYKAEYPFL
jgi:hypothetical protein